MKSRIIYLLFATTCSVHSFGQGGNALQDKNHLYAWGKVLADTSETDGLERFLNPRTGEEIYEDLFGIGNMGCTKILNFQDGIVSQAWLHFETCPQELERILSKHSFTSAELSTADWDGKVPLGESLGWFNPKTLGTTVWVYEFFSEKREILTIWTNVDKTRVFVRHLSGRK